MNVVHGLGHYDSKHLGPLPTMMVEVLQKVKERVEPRNVIKVFMGQQNCSQTIEVVASFDQVSSDTVACVDKQVSRLVREKSLSRDAHYRVQDVDFDLSTLNRSGKTAHEQLMRQYFVFEFVESLSYVLIRHLCQRLNARLETSLMSDNIFG